MKTLIAYFSATDITKKLAQNLAKATGGDLFETKPKVPYTDADLDWTNKNSRSTIESDKNELKLSFEEIKNICGFEINHSFLNSKKELENLGYEVAKISLKEKYILFKKIN